MSNIIQRNFLIDYKILKNQKFRISSSNNLCSDEQLIRKPDIKLKFNVVLKPREDGLAENSIKKKINFYLAWAQFVAKT